MVNQMDFQKSLLLHIAGEAFLFTVPKLSREQCLNIESLAEGALDDYGDDIEEMSVFQLCEWFQDKVKELFGIELKNASIDYEITMKVAE